MPEVHETTSAYDPALGAAFNKCYQVFFGCPGADNIGSDTNGDGMTFSFWKNSATYNINNGAACGGGLGYMNSASDGRMNSLSFRNGNCTGNTVSFVEFFVGGVSIGTDNTATSSYNYGLNRNAPADGNHSLLSTVDYLNACIPVISAPVINK